MWNGSHGTHLNITGHKIKSTVTPENQLLNLFDDQ